MRIVISDVAAIIMLAATATITVGLSCLEPVAPTVERQTLLIDSFERYNIIPEVGDVGTLVSEYILDVPREVSGWASLVAIRLSSLMYPDWTQCIKDA
jgi:hypothetical protein